jgi:O-antigen/teichoic acid export membrane protein
MLLRPALIVGSFALMYLVWGPAIELRHAFWALALGALGAAVSGGVVLRRLAPQALASAVPQFHTREWASSALLMAGNSGLLLLNSYTDILMLGALGSMEQVGIYRIATQVSLLSGFVYTAVNMLATPRFATLRAAGDTATLQATAVFMARLALLGTLPLPLLFLLFGSSPLGFVFGAAFQASYEPMWVLFLGQFVNAMAGMASSQLMMSGNESKLLRFTVVAVVVNAATSAVLIPRFGVIGAALGNTLAMSVWSLATWAGSVHLTGMDTSVFGLFANSRTAQAAPLQQSVVNPSSGTDGAMQ